MAGSDDTLRSKSDLGTDKTVGGDGATTGPTVDESDLASGHTVGEYEIEDVIGRGGFGTVYRATQPVIGKRVAIKVLSRKYSADREMVSRFVAEARAVNQIRHRHIIDIFSFGQLPDGRQYYVMEHLDGEPLDQYLASHGSLTLEQALPILRAVARALDAAHAKGVAHRDLKPENVFLARDDEGGLFPKLLDFGIAKLDNPEERHAHKTNTGVPIGTPYYMSPEQCRGQNVDSRTDIYSFGVLAYRLLTGAFPFDGSLVDILHQHMYDEPPLPSTRNPAIPKSADEAVRWMMRKEPDQRPKTAIAAVVALHGHSAPTPMITPSQLELGDATGHIPRTKSRKWLVPTIGMVVAIAAGVVIFVTVRGGDTREPVVVERPAPGSQVAPTLPPPPPPPVEIKTVPPPPKPMRVIITVSEVPEGTEVLVAGAVVGTAPGPVQLDKSTERIVLTFRAENHATQSKEVVPDGDKRLSVGLKKRRATGGTVKPPTKPTDDPDAIANPFGKEKP